MADAEKYIVGSELKTVNGESLVGVGDISTGGMVEITWSELKLLRDSSGLTPGTQYRITDYNCTTVQEDTLSAGNQFDILVVADDDHTINENARACLHSGDTYFSSAGANLNGWKLKYRLDNDTSRFLWADSGSAGRGVIYYMKDEWGNECSYDFKNIQFARFKITECEYVPSLEGLYSCRYPSSYITVDTGTTYWCYTFSMINLFDNIIDDVSTYQNKYAIGGGIEKTESNVIKECFDYYIDYDRDIFKFLEKIPSNVFVTDTNCCGISSDYSSGDFYPPQGNIFKSNCVDNTFAQACKSNSFGEWCCNNTFGDYAYGNVFDGSMSDSVFGVAFSYNTIGNASSENVFKDYCYYNILGCECSNNTFGEGCSQNTFGHMCYSNFFGDDCTNNTFGNYCFSNILVDASNNIFGNFCYRNSNDGSGGYFRDNIFGNTFQENLFGYGCAGNIFGNGVNNNTFGDNCTNNIFGNNFFYNTIGSDFDSNTIGNSCDSNTFMDGCFKNTLGNICCNNVFSYGCAGNTLGDGCCIIELQNNYTCEIIVENGNKTIGILTTQTTAQNTPLRNITIAQGTHTGGTFTVIYHNTVNDTFRTTYQNANSQTISV